MQVYFNDAVQPILSLNCDISTLSCSTTIGSLDPYVLYSIQVSCSTGAGEGPRTNTISVKTLIGSEYTIVCMVHCCIPYVCKFNTQLHSLSCVLMIGLELTIGHKPIYYSFEVAYFLSVMLHIALIAI